MSQLDQLPIELLVFIARYITDQRSIYALVQTNKNLYHSLYFFLCQYNIQHHQSSALLWAAQKGYTHLAIKLLDAGANIATFENPTEVNYDKENTEDLSMINPLLMAAQGGHITTLRALLSKKQPDQACSPAQLRTVLHWAIRTHNSELLELMIKHEAPLDPAGDSQEALSALGVAVSSRYNFIIPRLLKIGARSGYGEYPCPIEQAICTDQPQLVELFLKHGMRLNGDNGLCYIAQQGDKYLLQLLLDYGLDLDLYGNAALFTAIMEGQYEMTEFLINNGSNPHLLCELWRRDKLCFIGAPTYSSIEFAIHFQHLDILKLLLEKGVLPRQKEFDLAVKEYKEAVALLSKFPKDSSRRKLIEVYVIFAGQKRWEKDPNFKMPFTSAGVWDSTSTSSTSELTTINGEPVWLE